MADEVQEQSGPLLAYPQLLLEASFDCLLSNSYETAPNMTRVSSTELSDAEASLSESWSTLSCSDISREEDLISETTDAGSLLSGHGTDELHSVDDDTAGVETEQQALEEASNVNTEGGSAHDNAPPNPETTASVSNSTATVKNFLPDAIEFEEPESWPKVGQVDLKHTVCVFDGEEAAQVQRSHHGKEAYFHLVGTIRMTMSKSRLELDRPFRLLYVGDPKARPDILAKIGDTMIAGAESGFGQQKMESSRYHVIPASFGPGSLPNYADLVPIQTQMIVDELTDASPGQQGLDEITLQLKNGRQFTSRWTGTKYEVSPFPEWPFPDLVIFYRAQEDTSDMTERHQLTHAFISAHQIPFMVISSHCDWSSNFTPFALDRRSLHFCLEARESASSENRILRRLPIDLNTFESLDAEQLSKNLGCLVKKPRKFPGQMESLMSSFQWVREHLSQGPADVEKNLSNSLVMRARTSGVVHLIILTIISLVCTGILLAGFQSGLAFWSHMSQRPMRIDATPATSTEVATCTPVRIASVIATPSTASVSLSSYVSTSSVMAKDLTTLGKSDIAALIAHPIVATVNRSESDRFHVQILGDCHALVKLPISLIGRRKMPAIDVDVTRHGMQINATLSKLFDGLFTIRFNREDAFGQLNVSIKVTKPPFFEVHEVDFGSPWFKVSGWKKTGQIIADQVRDDLATAQKLLIATAQRIFEEMPSAEQVNTKLREMRLQVGELPDMIQEGSKQTMDQLQEKYNNFRKRSTKCGITASRVLQSEINSFRLSLQGIQERELAAFDRMWSRLERNGIVLRQAASDTLAKAQMKARQVVEEARKGRRSRRAARRVKSHIR